MEDLDELKLLYRRFCDIGINNLSEAEINEMKEVARKIGELTRK